ncbi:MAG: DNA polymerase III subunit gamma/tau [Bacteroidota bacterium]
MSYIVTARKWRPLVFEDVIGQSHVTTTLRNAIATNRLSHAYLFSGPRGVGKTTTARILAKAINCLHPAKDRNPDNECELCQEISEGRSLNVFEIDGASNRSIDDIRNLREAVRYAPAKGNYKVYIIDEVHMLTKEAFNALLKTLEEPPESILFIFATTEVYKVPATILSRCQRFDFRRNTIEEMTERLSFIAGKEKIKISKDALMLIAKKADGSMRDCQSIFDQIIAFCGDNIDAKQIREVLNIVDEELFFRMTEIIKTKDSKGCLSLVEEIVSQGVELKEFLHGMNEHFRNLLVARISGSTKLIETADVYKKQYEKEGSAFPENMLLRYIRIIDDAASAIKYDPHPRFKFEITLLLLLKIENSLEISELLNKLGEIKKKLDESPAGVGGTPSIFDEGRPAVRGSVKATPPTLRAEQIVPPSGASAEPGVKYVIQKETKSSVVSSTDGKKTQPAGNISLDHIREKWSLLIDGASKHKIALGTMLSESSPIDLKAEKLSIACPDEFHVESLKRNKDFLLQLVHEVYGTKLRLELEKGSMDTDNDNNNGGQSTGYKSPELDHPVIQALVREVGARQIDP